MMFFITLLEGSGYMARAAFVMDRAMHAIGLHGKSFIPMLLGFLGLALWVLWRSTVRSGGRCAGCSGGGCATPPKRGPGLVRLGRSPGRAGPGGG